MAKIPMGWADTFAELPTGRVAADALIGGGLGMGANYAANSSSGDTGGYLQAGLIGGAIGGVTRGVLSKAGAEKAASQISRSDIPDAVLGPSMAKAASGVRNLAVGVRDKSVSAFGKVTDMPRVQQALKSSGVHQKAMETSGASGIQRFMQDSSNSLSTLANQGQIMPLHNVVVPPTTYNPLAEEVVNDAVKGHKSNNISNIFGQFLPNPALPSPRTQQDITSIF